MIVDSSAIVAIILQEPEAAEFSDMIIRSSDARMSAVAYVEVAMRIDTPQNGVEPALDAALAVLGVEVVPFDAAQGMEARSARARFGKGRHPAKLNFGDCMTYALAKLANEPLLFKGNDFSQTDLRRVAKDDSRT